jgi:hypothetical protein
MIARDRVIWGSENQDQNLTTDEHGSGEKQKLTTD